MAEQVLKGGFDVEVAPTEILVGGKGILALEQGRVPLFVKRERDFLIPPLKAAIDELKANEKRKSLCLAMDRDTPYRLLAEVMYTLGQAGMARVDLAVDAGAERAHVIPYVFPRLEERQGGLAGVLSGKAVENVPLKLVLVVSKTAMRLRLSGGECPDCEAIGRRTGSKLNIKELAGKLRKIKARFPEHESITLMAEENLRFADVVRILDQVRGTASKPLFPDLRFAAGLR